MWIRNFGRGMGCPDFVKGTHDGPIVDPAPGFRGLYQVRPPGVSMNGVGCCPLGENSGDEGADVLEPPTVVQLSPEGRVGAKVIPEETTGGKGGTGGSGVEDYEYSIFAVTGFPDSVAPESRTVLNEFDGAPEELAPPKEFEGAPEDLIAPLEPGSAGSLVDEFGEGIVVGPNGEYIGVDPDSQHQQVRTRTQVVPGFTFGKILFLGALAGGGYFAYQRFMR